VQLAYAAMPDRIYVIDAAGKIAYKGGPGPGGFKAMDVPPVLDKLLGVSLASNFPASRPDSSKPERGPDSRPGGMAGEMRERVSGMLTKLGLEEKDSKAVLQAVDKRMQAYREVMQARQALMMAIRQKDDTAKPLAALQEAQKEYTQMVEKIDQNLDETIGYSKKPDLLAALTAFGLIGNSPAPPMSGLAGMGGGGK
jgi:hypothetical protein